MEKYRNSSSKILQKILANAKKKTAFTLYLWLCTWIGVEAQVRIKGTFLQDSLEVGLPIQYALVAEYNADLQVVFPDSSYVFEPFTYLKKQYFDTQTNGRQSKDSVIYELTTYEIALKQKLSLPIFLQRRDSLQPYYAKPDSIYLIELVKGEATQQKPKPTLSLQEVEYLFNYPYWLAGFTLILVLLIPIWLLFGKRIVRNYKLLQFQTRHSIFLQEFSRISNRINTRKLITDIEKALGLWKKHLEVIESRPYSSYTSKEIGHLLKNNRLLDALKNIDRAVYGQEVSSTIIDELDVLKRISVERYEQKKEEMRYVE